MPDLYTQIANGTYGRSRDRWQPEPDFDEITFFEDDEENDGEDADYSLLDEDEF